MNKQHWKSIALIFFTQKMKLWEIKSLNRFFYLWLQKGVNKNDHTKSNCVQFWIKFEIYRFCRFHWVVRTNVMTQAVCCRVCFHVKCSIFLRLGFHTHSAIEIIVNLFGSSSFECVTNEKCRKCNNKNVVNDTWWIAQICSLYLHILSSNKCICSNKIRIRNFNWNVRNRMKGNDAI